MPEGKPHLFWSRANVKQMRKETIMVQRCAMLMMAREAGGDKLDIVGYPTFWAPPGNDHAMLVKRIIRGYNQVPDMLDVYMTWVGYYPARAAVFKLDYRKPKLGKLFVGFDFDKYYGFLREATQSTVLMLSFSKAPSFTNGMNTANPESDPNMVALQTSEKVQAELGQILDMWRMYRAESKLKPEQN